MNDTVVFYNGEQVSVPKEVAEFLEEDRKRAQAQARQDKRHLSRSEFETVLSSHVPAGRPLERYVLRNLQLENLRKAVAELSAQEQELISLRYDGELSMEEIGKVFVQVLEDAGVYKCTKEGREAFLKFIKTL